MSLRVGTSDPYHYPYAILSKRLGTPPDDGYELHFLDAGTKAEWKAHAQALRDSGEFDWVRFTTINFMDDDTGELLGG